MADYQKAVTRGHAVLLVNNADALIRFGTYNKRFLVSASPVTWMIQGEDGATLLELRAVPTAEGVNIEPVLFAHGPWEEEWVRWVYDALADAAVWRLRRALIDEVAESLMAEVAASGDDPRSDEELLQDEIDHHAAQRADLP